MVFIVGIGRIRCLYEIIVMSKDIVFLLKIGGRPFLNGRTFYLDVNCIHFMGEVVKFQALKM